MSPTKVPPLVPDNMPRRRRPDPDDQPTAATVQTGPEAPNPPARPDAPTKKPGRSTRKQAAAEPDRAGARVAEAISTEPGVDGPSVRLDAIVGVTDPELDFTNLSTRVPRHIRSAFDLAARLGRLRKQEVITNALRAAIPPEFLDAAFRKDYPHLKSPYADEQKGQART